MSARPHPSVCHRVSRHGTIHRQSNSSKSMAINGNQWQSMAINGNQRHSGRTMRPNRTQRGKGAFGDEGGHQHAISMQLPCAQTQPNRAREGCLRCSCRTRGQGRGWTPIKRRPGAIRRQLVCNQETACNQGGHLARRPGEGESVVGGRT